MLAEWTGLEPATPGVTGRYSNQLNYHSGETGVVLNLAFVLLVTTKLKQLCKTGGC
jgi:hypothetical protein